MLSSSVFVIRYTGDLLYANQPGRTPTNQPKPTYSTYLPYPGYIPYKKGTYINKQTATAVVSWSAKAATHYTWRNFGGGEEEEEEEE